MQFTSWGRLVRLYESRLSRLLTAWRADRGPEWEAAVRKTAEEMVREVARVNAKSWREAAMKSTRARQIFTALESELRTFGMTAELERIANRNARLISSLPYDIRQQITLKAAEFQRQGLRASEVESEIRRLAPRLAESRIQLIARTEISRAETDVTRARSENVGIEWYVWETSEDQRVRESHRLMNGVLVAWNAPPNPEKLAGEKSTTGPYAPGSIWNCRCIALPLADLAEVSWPARVFTGNRIVRMNRKKFGRMAGIPLAA